MTTVLEKIYDKQPLVNETNKNKYGQYFTPKIVAEFMVGLADINTNANILEPSSGEGVFIEVLQSNGFQNIDAYEIDKELRRRYDFVKNESFVSASISQKYDLVIGNPPYIRWKNLEDELKEELATNYYWNKYFNSLCDYLYVFILKSIEILEENGQLIFICPEYWMNTTHSISLRNYMVSKGYFEKIYHFNETPIFSNATVSIVIFKYIKSKEKQPTIDVVKYYKNKKLSREILNEIKNSTSEPTDFHKFSVNQFLPNDRWLLTDTSEVEKVEAFERICSTKIKPVQSLFDKEPQSIYPTIGEVCDIGNGMVSGLDKAFQLNGQALNKLEEESTIEVIKAKNLLPYTHHATTQYIFVNEVEDAHKFEVEYPNFHKKLTFYKEKLIKRYQYNREIKYWQWVFLRNYDLFNNSCPRIFVPCKERISNKNYFRFAYVEAGIFPTQDVTAIFPKQTTKESIYYILAFLNNHRVLNWLKNKGIVKGNIVEFSEKPISSIPFRAIDWSNSKEVSIHNDISILTQQYVATQDVSILNKINDSIDKLLS